MAIIKAGTYRFNDTIPFEGVDAIWQDLVYTVIGAIILDPSTFTVVYNADEVITFNNLTVIEDGDADRIVFNWDDQNAEQPDGTVIFVPDIIYNNSSKWDTCYTYAKGFQIDMPSLKGYGQTITIPNDSDVSAEFYEWFTANAVPVMASITHNGSTLAELFPGQTATLKCKGMKMEDDVVVAVGELPETEIPEPKLQEKTATENGEVLPDDGYDGLSKVTVAVEGEVVEDYDGTITIA